MSSRQLRTTLVSLAALGLLVGLGAGLAHAGGDLRTPAMATSGAQLSGVNFISRCGFSHRAPDDPIVFPGHPGWSHDHSFVGNTSTNAFSTLTSLLGAGTTCQRAGDTAAYWMPTLMLNGATGSPVPPLGATVYYRRRSLAAVEAFPPGLKMIAGDSKAVQPQSRRIVFWNCGVAAGLPPSAAPPVCPAGRKTTLRLHVTFPSCWNGRDLDSADHKSHLTYPTAGRCPAAYAVSVPQISVIFRYPETAGPVSLSSGGVYSAHADFFNAWNQDELTRLVDECLNALRHCARAG